MQAFLFSLFLAVAPGGGAAQQPVHAEDPDSSAAFQQQLLTALRKAGRIVLTEHSDKYDSFDRVTSEANGPYHVYASHQLSAEERKHLIDAVAAVDPQAGPSTLCMFSPHHAVDFYAGEQRDSRLEICFTCGDMEWDAAANASYPQELVGVFNRLAKQSGMKTDQNWVKKLEKVQAGQ